MPGVIGLVVPEAVDMVPPEAASMYPGLTFIARGIGLRALSTEGYDEAIGRVVPAACELAARGADAVMVIGTSLTFYRGAAFHDDLVGRLTAATGRPAGTMSGAIVEGLREAGARRLAVCTAYSDAVNAMLATFLAGQDFQVGALNTVAVAGRVGEAARITEQDIVASSVAAFEDADTADGVLIVCGGLRTLGAEAEIERRCGVPVVSSMPAALRSAVRLAGHGIGGPR